MSWTIRNSEGNGYNGTLICLDLFARKCAEFVARFGTFSDPDDLQDQLQTILKSKDSSTCTRHGSDYSNGNSGNVIGDPRI